MSILFALIYASPAFVGFESERVLRENRLKVRDYSACVVKKHPADAAAAVMSIEDNAELAKKYPKVIDPYCFSGFTDSMAFSGDLLRYGLADALVRKELAGVQNLDPSLISPLVHRDPAPPLSLNAVKETTANDKTLRLKRYGFAVAVAYAQVSRLGECVIRANPTGAYRLLKSDVTAPDETVAMRALGPSLSICLDKGNTLHLTHEVLRGTIALNYYRLLKAPRIAAGAPH